MDPQTIARAASAASLAPLGATRALAEPEPLTAGFAELDRLFHALQGRLTLGVSPLGLPFAFADWALHSANAPFRCASLGLEVARSGAELGTALLTGDWIAPDPQDHRFSHPLWLNPPFAVWREAFLRTERWVDQATRGAPGVKQQNERVVNFTARQWLDAWSPSNAPWMNPEVIQATATSRGVNLVHGFENFVADAVSFAGGRPRENDYEVGRNLAVTPGEVVFRNALLELIQYRPRTQAVRPEPVLIAPAWIMKYYILDLSPHNSLVGYLVGQGYTVFCISWRNPGPELRDTGFEDYRRDGLMAALDAVSAITGAPRVHACGYCLGGTLLSIGAAAMARDGDDRLASVTLLCAQTDFSEAGELQLFTTEDEVAFLDDVMEGQGYLDGRQMGGAFQLLRSRDLIWSRLVKTYWLGERDHPNDLMVWNDDATRLPHRMHAEYLRGLYLRDDLSEGRFKVEGRPISVGDIAAPIFAVSTETDHVAPWRSVFKIQLLNPGEITFVLTSGGHNAGIVSEPGHPRRRYHVAVRPPGGVYVGPDEWLRRSELRDGSWWPAWIDWLSARSGPQEAPPPPLGAPARGYPALAAAPGSYVFER
jgi:polyhydroxyalkanoate synthase